MRCRNAGTISFSLSILPCLAAHQHTPVEEEPILQYKAGTRIEQRIAGRQSHECVTNILDLTSRRHACIIEGGRRSGWFLTLPVACTYVCTTRLSRVRRWRYHPMGEAYAVCFKARRRVTGPMSGLENAVLLYWCPSVSPQSFVHFFLSVPYLGTFVLC